MLYNTWHIHPFVLTFIHWWQRLTCKVLTCLSRAIMCFLRKAPYFSLCFVSYTYISKPVEQPLKAMWSSVFCPWTLWPGSGAREQTIDPNLKGQLTWTPSSIRILFLVKKFFFTKLLITAALLFYWCWRLQMFYI